jgi:hypothetical protein
VASGVRERSLALQHVIQLLDQRVDRVRNDVQVDVAGPGYGPLARRERIDAADLLHQLSERTQ